MEVFKVVEIKDGKAHSTVPSDFQGAVQYILNIATHRKPYSGPLTAFRTLEAAKRFKNIISYGGKTYAIYRAEAKKSIERNVWSFRQGKDYAELPLNMCPKGTVLCDWIKIIEIAAD